MLAYPVRGNAAWVAVGTEAGGVADTRAFVAVEAAVETAAVERAAFVVAGTAPAAGVAGPSAASAVAEA